jgi:hypothetical protein
VTEPPLPKTPSRRWFRRRRRERRIPEWWDWDWCGNRCGDVVFYDPAAKAIAVSEGIPFVSVCSADCALALGRKRGDL